MPPRNILSRELLIILPKDAFPRPLALGRLTELQNLVELINHFPTWVFYSCVKFIVNFRPPSLSASCL